VTTIRFSTLGKAQPGVRNCCGGHWRWPSLIWTLHILRVMKMLWRIICHECEITALYVVYCECGSFRGMPNCRGSLMNCVVLVECGLSFVSRVDVSPECALSRVVCAVLSFVAQRCIFVYLLLLLICILCMICICILYISCI